MTVRFLAPAKRELFRIYSRYERERVGLGDRFADEIQLALRSIRERPDAWIRLDESLRRRNLRRFPYHIVYAASGVTIFVIAVAHHRRRPGYWRRRLGRPEPPTS